MYLIKSYSALKKNGTVQFQGNRTGKANSDSIGQIRYFSHGGVSLCVHECTHVPVCTHVRVMNVEEGQRGGACPQEEAGRQMEGDMSENKRQMYISSSVWNAVFGCGCAMPWRGPCI